MTDGENWSKLYIYNSSYCSQQNDNMHTYAFMCIASTTTPAIKATLKSSQAKVVKFTMK